MPYKIGDELSEVSAVFHAGASGRVRLVELRRVTNSRPRPDSAAESACDENTGAQCGNGGAIPCVSESSPILSGVTTQAPTRKGAAKTWEAQLTQARQSLALQGEADLEISPCHCGASFGEHYHVDAEHTVPWLDFTQALYAYVHPYS